MGGKHFTSVINECIDLAYFSDGAITYEDAINMGTDETPYLIHIYKQRFEAKDQSKQDFIKACFEFASNSLKELFKAIQQAIQSKK